MPTNTVEAVLRSKYEDGVDQGVENTRALMERTFSSMKDASGAAAAGIDSAFESAVGSLAGWRTNLSKAADDSDSSFKRMSLGAAAVGIAFAEVFLRAAKAAADFVVEITKEASEVAAARFSFEALTAAQGQHADVMLGKLKVATEGQIGQLSLLRNANKVLGAELPLTGEQYLQLTENVARLAKSTGADAVAAQDALTTALIRGASRGLGPAIGIHLAVKDAVTEMAESMNSSAAAMPDNSKLQAFYNDLLEKTNAAVGKLPPQFVTLEEALTHAKTTWKDWLDDMGTAITRSGVFQGLLVELTNNLYGVTTSMDQQHRTALATNDALIELLRIIAEVAGAIGPVVTVVEFAWDVIKGIGFGVMGFFIHLADMLANFAAVTSRVLAFISGDTKHALDSIVSSIDGFRDKMDALSSASKDLFLHSFDGFGEGAKKLTGMSDAANKLAGDMEKLRGVVLDGSAGVTKLGKTAGDGVDPFKTLNEQLKTYSELMFTLAQATAQTPQEKAMGELTKQIFEIGKLDKLSETQRQAARDAAWEKYNADIAKQFEEEKARQVTQNDAKLTAQKRYQDQVSALQNEFELAAASDEQKAGLKRLQDIDKVNKLVWSGSEEGKRLLLLVEQQYDKEMDRIQAERLRKQQEAEKKSIEDAVSAANAITHAVEAVAKGTVSQSTALTALGNLPHVLDTLKQKLAELNAQPVVTDAQISQIEKLKTAIDQLNKINLSPLAQTLQHMRQQMQQFAVQSLQSFAQYLGGLISGQSKANQSLLELAGQMIGGLFTMAGTLLTQTGVAECAAALTMVGRAMGASFTGGLEAIAAGVALMALGSGMSGPGGSGGGGSAAAPQSSSSTSQQNANPQTISVGAARGSQPANPQATQHIIQLQVQSNDSHIVKVVQSNIGTNGELRVAVKR